MVISSSDLPLVAPLFYLLLFLYAMLCTHLNPCCKIFKVRAAALGTQKTCKVYAVTHPLSAQFSSGGRPLDLGSTSYTYSYRYLPPLNRLAPSLRYSFLMLVNFQSFLPSTGTSISFTFCIYCKQLNSIPKQFDSHVSSPYCITYIMIITSLGIEVNLSSPFICLEVVSGLSRISHF